ncbi:MAG: signal transduction protein [Candidatus Bathyarchaeota archaeon B63]|nr:MAG: signal transduction protein [Candidatus Bathyarchaeota archaeon B63]
MDEEIVTVDEGVSVAEAAARISEKGKGCAIVLSRCKPIGMLTERDITYKVVAKGLNPRKVRVSEVMSTPLVEVDPDADLVTAAKIMDEHKIRRLAVVRKGILYGVISALDIARNLEGYVETEVRKILRYAFFMG